MNPATTASSPPQPPRTEEIEGSRRRLTDADCKALEQLDSADRERVDKLSEAATVRLLDAARSRARRQLDKETPGAIAAAVRLGLETAKKELTEGDIVAAIKV